MRARFTAFALTIVLSASATVWVVTRGQDSTDARKSVITGVRVSGVVPERSDDEKDVWYRVSMKSASHKFDPAEVKPGGNFEFQGVPPGTYIVKVDKFSNERSWSWISRSGSTIVVGAEDISGIQAGVPFKGNVTGRIVSEKGIPLSGVTVEVRRPYVSADPTSISSTVSVGGMFSAGVTDGANEIMVRNLPVGYIVSSIRVDGAEMRGRSFIVAPQHVPGEVLVTAVPVESVAGVPLTGRLFSTSDVVPAGVRITLENTKPGGPLLEATVDERGAFEFAHVPAGHYALEAPTFPVSVMASVGTEPVTGIQMQISSSLR